MPLSPGSRLGPYEVVAQIGAGGMGEVYRATDSNLKRAVALKVLPDAVAADEDRLARFQREAEVLAALNHPHIAAIYGIEKNGGTTALVMELVEGPTLADLIESRGLRGPAAASRPFVDDTLSIARQIAEALEAAHDQGIVHRDLKPANIKVRPDGTVKVLDFGLARASGPSSSPSMALATTSPALTLMGVVLGTAAYMAPEQAKGWPVDRRADVWAFGAVLYEMLTGRRAFPGDDVTEVLASVLAREPDWAQLPPTEPVLSACVRRCLQRDPKQRFGDMQSVRLALEGAFATGLAGDLASQPPLDAARIGSARVGWAVAGVAVLGLLTLGLSYARRAELEPSVVRTMIPPPENAVFDFDVTVGPAVLSPNGRYVAFSARSNDGRVQLWVRSLDATDVHPIDGTDGGGFPFWSPDSRSLGFIDVARGRIERVALAGGAPFTVVNNAHFVRGASWGPGDRIAFDEAGGRIMVVSAAGGEAKAIVTSASPRSPWILPDGEHVLYLARQVGQVFVAAIDGSGNVPVTAATSNAVYASGQLLFMREDTLLAQPFDTSRRQLSGSPAPVARHVQMLLGEPRGVFSASDTGTLLYQDTGGGSATNLAWFDPAGQRQSTLGEVGSGAGVFMSPDGQHALVRITGPDGLADFYRINLSDGSRTRLTFETGLGDLSHFAVWSADGKDVAYAARREGTTVILRRPSDGGPERVLFKLPPAQSDQAPGLPRVSAWTADGSTLLYSGSDGGGIDALRLNGGSAPATPIATPFIHDLPAQNPRVSPNQRWVVYQASASQSVPGIFVDKLPDGGGRIQVTDDGSLPVWGADGKSLFYATGDNVLTKVDVVEVDGALRFGPPRRLMPIILGRGYSYDVTKDGRILALVTSERRAARPLTFVQNWTAALR